MNGRDSLMSTNLITKSKSVALATLKGQGRSLSIAQEVDK